MLRQLHNNLTKKETRKEGVEEGREEKWAIKEGVAEEPNLSNFRVK